MYAIGYESYNNNRSNTITRLTIVDELGKVVLDDHLSDETDRRKTRRFYTSKPDVQTQLINIINGHVIVGYSISFVLKFFEVTHPDNRKIDLNLIKMFQDGSEAILLNSLAHEHLDRNIEQNNSMDMAHACIDLYQMFSKQLKHLCSNQS